MVHQLVRATSAALLVLAITVYAAAADAQATETVAAGSSATSDAGTSTTASITPHASRPRPETPGVAGRSWLENVEVYVVTFGPGDHPFSKFGHNAILVVDPERGRDLVYNFGTFSFHSPTLIGDFMQGRLMYWVSVTRKATTLAAYAAQNRSVLAQQLNLTPAEKRALLQRLAFSALPENKFYRYHYYLDNCSTRVRDVLDEALAGRLQSAKNTPARLNWRQHTSRLTQDSLGVYLGLNLLLAGGVDRPASRWEEMFLPEVLSDELQRSHKSDGSPLVNEQTLWHQARRHSLAPAPSSFVGPMLLLGSLLGAALVGLSRLGMRWRPARGLLLALAALLGLLAGGMGCILGYFWIATDHELAHANENLLLFPPWALCLPVAVLAMLIRRDRWPRAASVASTVLAGGCMAGLLLKALPWFNQDNWLFLAFALPTWSGLAVALLLVSRQELRGTARSRAGRPRADPESESPKLSTRPHDAAPAVVE